MLPVQIENEGESPNRFRVRIAAGFGEGRERSVGRRALRLSVQRFDD